MPGKVTIKVEGVRQIEAALKELGSRAANRIARSALNRSATPVVRRAKELVPVRTGELKRAITKRLRRQRASSNSQEIVIGVERPTSRRAHFVEFGTVHQTPQPFLRPSLDERSAQALRIQKDAMLNGIERETRKLATRTRR